MFKCLPHNIYISPEDLTDLSVGVLLNTFSLLLCCVIVSFSLWSLAFIRPSSFSVHIASSLLVCEILTCARFCVLHHFSISCVSDSSTLLLEFLIQGLRVTVLINSRVFLWRSQRLLSNAKNKDSYQFQDFVYQCLLPYNRRPFITNCELAVFRLPSPNSWLPCLHNVHTNLPRRPGPYACCIGRNLYVDCVVRRTVVLAHTIRST